MIQLNIIKTEVTDVEELQKIAILTYREAFDQSNSEENMQDYLSRSFSTEQLTKELKNPNSAFYLAAYNQEIIGYLKLNFGDAQTEFKEARSLEIERIYVKSSFHGKQVGQRLFDKAIDIAKENNVDNVWLGVWEHNPKAIRFYEKNGLEVFDQHPFRMGDDVQTDLLMKLEFKSR